MYNPLQEGKVPKVFIAIVIFLKTLAQKAVKVVLAVFGPILAVPTQEISAKGRHWSGSLCQREGLYRCTWKKKIPLQLRKEVDPGSLDSEMAALIARRNDTTRRWRSQ